MDDYTGFVPHDVGVLLPVPIKDTVLESIVFIRNRTAEEHAEVIVKGAKHVEWRNAFSQLDDILTGCETVLFCKTGALVVQAVF